MGTQITIEHPFSDGDCSTVKRVYIIVHEPGKIPEKKIPRQDLDGVTEFLLALEMCRPKGTTYTVVQLIWTGDIWVSSGGEWLWQHMAATPRKFAKLKRKVAEEQRRITKSAA